MLFIADVPSITRPNDLSLVTTLDHYMVTDNRKNIRMYKYK